MTDTRATITRIEAFAEILREIAEIGSACAFVACVLIYAALFGGQL